MRVNGRLFSNREEGSEGITTSSGLASHPPTSITSITVWGDRVSYFDSSEQRDKARRAEQRLLEHSQIRPRRAVAPISEDEEITTLPPVFRHPDGWQTNRDTSLDRRNARFRDQDIYGPPPPPPVSPDAIPRMLPPRKFLVPQEVANQGVTNDPRYAVQPTPGHFFEQPDVTHQRDYEQRQPPPLRWVEAVLNTHEEYDLFAESAAVAPPPGQPPLLPQTVQDALTPSQKKRLRRKKAKLGKPGASPSPAPFPLQIDQPQASPNGHATTMLPPPEPVPEFEQHRTCDTEVLAQVVYRGQPITLRFRCPLTPWPHPNQPHLLKLDSAQDDGSEIFVGWWLDGE